MSLINLNTEQLTVNPTPLFEILGFPVTDSEMTVILVTLLVILLSFLYYLKAETFHINKAQAFFEMILEGFIGFIDQITGSRNITKKIFPIIGSVFLYVFISNTITLLIPGLTATTINGHSAFRAATDDFSTTFSLGVAIVLYSQYLYIEKHGFINYLNKFLGFKELIYSIQHVKEKPMGILEAIIGVFVGFLDFISEIAKSFSISLRLFGNMFAGDLLMGVFLSMIAILIPALWTFYSLFSGSIQALVFAALAASYCTASLKG